MRFDENLYTKMTLTGTSVSSDTFDLGAAGIAEGPGVFVVTVTTKATAATKVELQACDDNATFAAVGAASIAANSDVGTQAVIDVPLPQACGHGHEHGRGPGSGLYARGHVGQGHRRLCRKLRGGDPSISQATACVAGAWCPRFRMR